VQEENFYQRKDSVTDDKNLTNLKNSLFLSLLFGGAKQCVLKIPVQGVLKNKKKWIS
jgi:hypothetical protein